jgi:hypothetical protein
MVVIAEQRWTRDELEVAKALYRHSTFDPEYDFELDPKGWAKLMFLQNARVAIKAYKKQRWVAAKKAIKDE